MDHVSFGFQFLELKISKYFAGRLSDCAYRICSTVLGLTVTRRRSPSRR